MAGVRRVVDEYRERRSAYLAIAESDSSTMEKFEKIVAWSAFGVALRLLAEPYRSHAAYLPEWSPDWRPEPPLRRPLSRPQGHRRPSCGAASTRWSTTICTGRATPPAEGSARWGEGLAAPF
jgi:Family of unknown function (DUF6221)